ncbi:MAG: hypothetical protein H6739_29515 [Alphaproteobacteria bacterium]|nr:hypothetical protein [Alphaproteobacteria bacterium]
MLVVRPVGPVTVLGAVVVALVFIALVSRLREPTRREFNAIFVAGAGAAYLSGGLGLWEFAYTTVATVVAWRGLRSYRFVGLAWAMHTAWDVVHHLYGDPIVFLDRSSSAGCAVCDAVLALWFFAGAPSPWGRRRRGADTLEGCAPDS